MNNDKLRSRLDSKLQTLNKSDDITADKTLPQQDLSLRHHKLRNCRKSSFFMCSSFFITGHQILKTRFEGISRMTTEKPKRRRPQRYIP